MTDRVAESTPPRGRSHIAHAGITFVGLMSANVLAYVFYALVSRVLGVEAYGTFSSLLAVVLMLSAPATIAQLVVAKLASDLSGDVERLEGLVRSIDRVTVLTSLVSGAALAALSYPLAQFLHVSDPLLVTLAGLSLCGAMALPFLRGVLQGGSNFGAFALSNVAESLSKAMFAPTLGAVLGLRGALSGMALGYAAATVYTFVSSWPHRRGMAVPFPLRTVVRSSARVALAVVCLNVLLLYDVVLAKRYLDAQTAGLYGAAALASRALYSVIAFVPTVLLPQAAGRAARGERTRWIFVQAIGLTAAIATSALVVFGLFPERIVTVIAGRSFAAASTFLLPYLYAVGALALANVAATYNIARGHFAFVVPVACVAVGEIVAVVVRHRTAADLLQTIAVGHTLALLATATSLYPLRRGAADLRTRKDPA